MKKLFLNLFLVVVATISMYAQSEGLWQRSDGAAQFLLSEKSYGFELKFNDGILKAKYASDAKDGSPVYSAMFGNNVIVLIKITDDETIYITSTQDATLRKWEFVGDGQVHQKNQSQNETPLNNAAKTNPYKNQSGWQNTGYQNNKFKTQSGTDHQNSQFNTLDLVPGTGYAGKKNWLESEKRSLKSKIADAERRYKLASSEYQISIQFELDRLNRENDANNMKLLDLDQMKMRGEIK
ncbi:MAG: hypothetical protein WCO02_18400 [Bacteroidota bacterium]